MRKTGKILFVLYVLFMIYFLVFSDWYGRTGASADYRYNLVLFTEIRRFCREWEILGWQSVFMNLAGNVLVFVPFGFLMALAKENPNFFAITGFSLGFSLLVELFQLFTRVGSFDVDDLLLNTIGGVFGYIFFLIWRTRRRRYDKK